MMKNNLLVYIAKLNFIFPFFLGVKFIRYRYFFKKNYGSYDNTSDLLASVNRALKTIPYYKNLNINPISSIEEFKRHISVVDKDIIMENWKQFIRTDYDKSKVDEGTTGGTSGKPLRLFIPKDRYIVELNTMNSMWGSVGWKGQMRGVIRNAHLKNGELFRVNPLKKEIIFDGFNTNKEYYEYIYDTIKKFKIKYLHAYPSSAYQLALFLKKTKKDCSIIKAFLCGSEGLTELQKNLITKELNILIYNWYGHSEKLVLGGPCMYNDAIHIEPTYGYFELLDNNGNHISSPGEIGEIVGSGIHNPYMAFLRYRSGDFAEYVGNYCSECKRHLPLIKNIQGRREKNQIYLNDGSYVSITALNLHSDLYLFIEGMQYIQKERGALEILLVKGSNFTSETEERFKEHFNKSLYGKCTYQIIYIDKILKEPNGKFLPLKQLIKGN